MSVLRAIILTDVAGLRNSADALGELFRGWAFSGEGFGCYSTFELRSEFQAKKVTDREFRLLWGRTPDPEDREDFYGDIHWFVHPNGLEVGWHWDGDGYLCFYLPELEDAGYTGAVINNDCKCSYGWKFGEK